MSPNCLDNPGRFPECNDCSIGAAAYCDMMVQRIKAYRYAMLNGIDRDDQATIITETIDAIKRGISRYRGNSDSQFSAYVRSILYHKKADFFRRVYVRVSNFKIGDIADMPSLIEQINDENDRARECLRGNFSEDTLKLLSIDDPAVSNPAQKKATKAIVKDLNVMLGSKEFTKKCEWIVARDSEYSPLAKKNDKTREETRRLNRTIIEKTYPAISSAYAGKIAEIEMDDIVGTEAEVDKRRCEDQLEARALLGKIHRLSESDGFECVKELITISKLRLEEGITIAKIAASMKISKRTLARRISDCRELLARAMGEEL